MSQQPRKVTTQDEARVLMRRIRIWEGDKTKSANCPLCDAPGLTIIDQSARPYSEWYAVTCAHCGLDDKIHVASATRAT